MSASSHQYVSAAMRRLRVGVLLSCWIIGLALIVQIVVWSLATCTDLRYHSIEDQSEVPLIVSAPATAAATDSTSADWSEEDEHTPPDPNRVLSKFDQIFETTIKLTGGLGKIAMLALGALLTVGILLAAGSATPGVERVVSAFTCMIVVAVLVLPFGTMLNLPWDYGALSPYGSMVESIDRVDANGWMVTAVALDVQFMLMPAVCLIAVILVGLRFAAGVEAALVRPDLKLDPALEAEIAKIKATSLHGGSRAAGALNDVVKTPDTPAPAPTPAPQNIPSARHVSPGEAPQRII